MSKYLVQGKGEFFKKRFMFCLCTSSEELTKKNLEVLERGLSTLKASHNLL